VRRRVRSPVFTDAGSLLYTSFLRRDAARSASQQGGIILFAVY